MLKQKEEELKKKEDELRKKEEELKNEETKQEKNENPETVDKNQNNINKEDNINIEQKPNQDQSINKDSIEKKNTLTDSKRKLRATTNLQKILANKETKKEKALSKFIQNLRKATNNKKNKLNFLEPDQKKNAKVSNKIKIIKNPAQEREEEKEVLDEKDNQNENQIEDPLIEHVRNELLKENEEEMEKQKDTDLNNNENLEEDVNIPKKEVIKTGYTGFVLLKQTQGVNIFQFKFEGNIEEMNNIFKTHKIELDKGQVELIYTKDLEDLRKIIEEKDEIIKKLKEIKEKEQAPPEPVSTARIRSIEERAAKQEAKDNQKIQEMKERIRLYKDELRKGDDIGIGIERRKRLSYHSKYNDYIEKQLVESTLRKITSNENESLSKLKDINNINSNLNTNQQISTINKEENKPMAEALPEKKQYYKIENEPKKEKDRDKSMSRAMDRFKRRYKKDNSVEIRAKKSEKINEMAKQLENVLGRANASAELNYESKLSNEIVHEDEREGNMEEILESQPVIAKKPKKFQQFQL